MSIRLDRFTENKWIGVEKIYLASLPIEEVDQLPYLFQ